LGKGLKGFGFDGKNGFSLLLGQVKPVKHSTSVAIEQPTTKGLVGDGRSDDVFQMGVLAGHLPFSLPTTTRAATAAARGTGRNHITATGQGQPQKQQTE